MNKHNTSIPVLPSVPNGPRVKAKVPVKIWVAKEACIEADFEYVLGDTAVYEVTVYLRPGDIAALNMDLIDSEYAKTIASF